MAFALGSLLRGEERFMSFGFVTRLWYAIPDDRLAIRKGDKLQEEHVEIAEPVALEESRAK